MNSRHTRNRQKKIVQQKHLKKVYNENVCEGEKVCPHAVYDAFDFLDTPLFLQKYSAIYML